MRVKELIIALYADSYNDYTGQRNEYIAFYANFGHVILVHSETDPDWIIKHADVLAMPGGADVDPRRYGEISKIWTGRANAQYEMLDTYLLTDWIKTGKPIIGICRGMQSLNVACGGTLHQHIIGHVGDKDFRAEPHHELYTIVDGYEIYPVNSYHHQAVKDLAPDFEVLGWSLGYRGCQSHRDSELSMPKLVLSEKQGKILKSKDRYYAFAEIIRHKDKPFIGFQYHPEEFDCILAHKLINETLEKYYESKKKGGKAEAKNADGAEKGAYLLPATNPQQTPVS